jgi:hypothetical protein
MMTMAEIQHTLADLIKFSSDQKPIEFVDAFNDIITSRVDTAINTKKIEVAQRMFNPSFDSDNEDTEIETEEE